VDMRRYKDGYYPWEKEAYGREKELYSLYLEHFK
jgi:hypothetical protein